MPMSHLLHVRDVHRWMEFNEYEGEISGELDGVPVTCYFLAAPAELWDVFRVGATLTVGAWLERSGDVCALPPGTPAALTQVGGSMYDLVGTIVRRDGEELQVDSVVPLAVDLDLRPGVDPPELGIGDVVGVRGMLKVELPDE